MLKIKWYLVDASSHILGRLASEKIAPILLGKNDVFSVRNKVVVINSNKVVVSGKKENQKTYHSHSQYHGGYKKRKLKEVRKNNSILIIRKAVRGMLPKNKIYDRIVAEDLLIYSRESHPHRNHFVEK